MAKIEMAEAAAQRPKAGKKVLQDIVIARAMDGGHVMTHRYQGYQHDPRVFNFGPKDGARAASHLARHAGLPMAGASEADGAEDGEGDE
jgi:hypothetical protein